MLISLVFDKQFVGSLEGETMDEECDDSRTWRVEQMTGLSKYKNCRNITHD